MPATKAHQITEPRMRANSDAQTFGLFNGATHGAWVACVKAGGDIGRTDESHQLGINAVADGPFAEAFTHVRVEIYLHGFCSRGYLSGCKPR